ncbi:1722_t:CDS:2, partial [Gigaspora margarita]
IFNNLKSADNWLEALKQLFSDDIHEIDEWIKNLENSGCDSLSVVGIDKNAIILDLDETKKKQGLLFALIGVECDEHIELDFQPEIDLQVTEEIDKNILGNSGNFDI